MNLEAKAAELRRMILETALKAGKGHIPPALSWVEIAVALYHGGVLNYAGGEDRDRFILSKGHGCLTLYAALKDLGIIPTMDNLPGHPDTDIPGIDACSGSLGHGLGVGAGMALGAKLSGKFWRTFVLLGDGELNEGSIWEAAMFASHHKLDNLVAILDYNKLCSANWTRHVIDGNWKARWQAFGWHFEECDGHSVPAITERLELKMKRPLILFAHTIKGRGIEFMEASPAWHHRVPKDDEIEEARRALA